MVVFQSIISPAQNLTQIVRGSITDKISEAPLAGASVSVDGTSLAAITQAYGAFVLRVSIGRIKINISFIGYQTASIPEVLVTTGKEVVLDTYATK